MREFNIMSDNIKRKLSTIVKDNTIYLRSKVVPLKKIKIGNKIYDVKSYKDLKD